MCISFYFSAQFFAIYVIETYLFALTFLSFKIDCLAELKYAPIFLVVATIILFADYSFSLCSNQLVLKNISEIRNITYPQFFKRFVIIGGFTVLGSILDSVQINFGSDSYSVSFIYSQIGFAPVVICFISCVMSFYTLALCSYIQLRFLYCSE